MGEQEEKGRLMSRNTAKLVVALLALSGCAVTPKPLTNAELSTRAAKNVAEVVPAEQEPVAGQIGLYEAMARALKYNLDYKTEMMEQALKTRELDITRYDMLPQLVATGGYAGRNTFAGASSLSLLSGRQSLEPSTSSERNIFTADLTLSWDVLDFGLSYVRAKQKADEVLIAMERRRKVSNRIIEDVRVAYWRAVSAERLIDKLKQLEGSVAATLTNSETLATRRRSAPLTALTYQRELIDIQAEIRRLQRELVVAKSQLAALMNLRPGTPFTLVLPQRDAAAPKFAMNTEGMVMTAMRNRAELREASYRERINKRELDAALLSALPSFRGIIGVNADSNDFLYNNDWVSYGARASFNLFNVFRLPAQKKVVEANADLIRQRELALTMAVMTQIYVSQARYTHLTAELTTATKQNKVQQAIMYQIRSGHTAGIVSQQTLLREEMNTLVNEVKYDLAYAELQNAYANLYAAMGVDHFSPDVTGRESVASLSQAMASMWAERETALKLD
jgi:outer membrane protein TolC